MEKTLKQIKHDEQTKIIKNNGAFFAFNDQQFKEQKKQNTIYVNIGVGLICPKNNAKTLKKELDDLNKKAIKKQMETQSIKDIVFKNCFNYELQYSFNGFEQLKEILQDYPIKETELSLYYNQFIDHCLNNDLI
tara:strand:+ start:1552 stop:1953 length:402 start_codon:yes stop_codon:yes gene_type:complete